MERLRVLVILSTTTSCVEAAPALHGERQAGGQIQQASMQHTQHTNPSPQRTSRFCAVRHGDDTAGHHVTVWKRRGRCMRAHGVGAAGPRKLEHRQHSKPILSCLTLRGTAVLGQGIMTLQRRSRLRGMRRSLMIGWSPRMRMTRLFSLGASVHTRPRRMARRQGKAKTVRSGGGCHSALARLARADGRCVAALAAQCPGCTAPVRLYVTGGGRAAADLRETR